MMQDWLVALVGYIFGDQIFVIGGQFSLFHEVVGFFFFFLKLFLGDNSNPAQPRSPTCTCEMCHRGFSVDVVGCLSLWWSSYVQQ